MQISHQTHLKKVNLHLFAKRTDHTSPWKNPALHASAPFFKTHPLPPPLVTNLIHLHSICLRTLYTTTSGATRSLLLYNAPAIVTFCSRAMSAFSLVQTESSRSRNWSRSTMECILCTCTKRSFLIDIGKAGMELRY